MSTQFKLCLSF